MKRYDSPEDMAKALDIFLFDTLSDPDLEVTDAPQEPAFAPAPPAPKVTVKAQGSDGKVREYHVNKLPRTRRECRNLAAFIILDPVAKTLDAATRKARLEIAVAALQKAVDLS